MPILYELLINETIFYIKKKTNKLSKSADGKANKTVLVFIHGGGFARGSATDKYFGPDFLLTQNLIIVEIQYRLGVFGFMNLGVDEYSGNMGLKDQQIAIKWIYENIENFSGNKNEIMLFGHSAGNFFK